MEATKLRKAIIEAAEAHAAKLAAALVDKALTGDVPALREIFDRGLGKSHQAIDMTSAGERIFVSPLDPRVAAVIASSEEEIRKALTDE